MGADEIEAWHATDESRRVGQKRPDGDSIGRAAGRLNVAILRSPAGALGEEEYRQMRRTVGFVRRHLAQRPDNTVTSRWRYALMNWGHDPLKEPERNGGRGGSPPQQGSIE
jgi:hypothetical protein